MTPPSSSFVSLTPPTGSRPDSASGSDVSAPLGRTRRTPASCGAQPSRTSVSASRVSCLRSGGAGNPADCDTPAAYPPGDGVPGRAVETRCRTGDAVGVDIGHAEKRRRPKGARNQASNLSPRRSSASVVASTCASSSNQAFRYAPNGSKQLGACSRDGAFPARYFATVLRSRPVCRAIAETDQPAPASKLGPPGLTFVEPRARIPTRYRHGEFS